MALIHIEKTGQLTYSFTGPGMAGEAAITLGIKTENDNVQEIADKANAAWRSTLKLGQCQDYQLIRVKAALLLPIGVVTAESFVSLPAAGGANSHSFPANTAILIQKRTILAGRKNRGRFYIPGVPLTAVHSDSDPNTLHSDALIAIQSQADAFLVALNDDTGSQALQPVLLHPEPATTVTGINALSVQARLATQRGRLRD